jgi:prepilin-type N-terminal cleavage/methylation domain-containing protein
MINRKKLKSAFTLIEMLVVMALMALMIGIGVTSFYGIGGSSALNGAVNEVQGALSLARQQTVLQNSSVNIYFYQDTNSNDIVYEMWAMTNEVDVSYDDIDNKYGYKLGSLFHFPKGLTVKVNNQEIGKNNQEYISLRPTGVTPEEPISEIILTETDETDQGYIITVYNITGLTSVGEIIK